MSASSVNQSEQPSGQPDELWLDAVSAAQFSYHARMAAVFAVGGDAGQSASESILAWTILATQWHNAAANAMRTAQELVGQDVASLSDAHRMATMARARDAALGIEAHYVSTGQHAEAHLYSNVADHVGDAIASLVAD